MFNTLLGYKDETEATQSSELGVERYLVPFLVHLQLQRELTRIGDDNVYLWTVLTALLDVF